MGKINFFFFYSTVKCFLNKIKDSNKRPIKDTFLIYLFFLKNKLEDDTRK